VRQAPTWGRADIADALAQFWEAQSTKGTSQRGFAEDTGIPRTTLQRWLGRRDSLVLWDVTDPDFPERVWIFPSDGTLSMPHGPLLRPHDGGWMLVYAHTQSVELDGLSALGSLGLGWTDTLTTRPTYLGDGLLPEALGPMAYHRGVELAGDGTLYLAESIDLFRGGQGRLTTASLPTLGPAGLSGAWDADHSQLAWFTLDDAVVLDGDLDNLFQVRLFTPPGPAD
jgi:hypothetical protein